jgi:hypothetical protein
MHLFIQTHKQKDNITKITFSHLGGLRSCKSIKISRLNFPHSKYLLVLRLWFTMWIRIMYVFLHTALIRIQSSLVYKQKLLKVGTDTGRTPQNISSARETTELYSAKSNRTLIIIFCILSYYTPVLCAAPSSRENLVCKYKWSLCKQNQENQAK